MHYRERQRNRVLHYWPSSHQRHYFHSITLQTGSCQDVICIVRALVPPVLKKVNWYHVNYQPQITPAIIKVELVVPRILPSRESTEHVSSAELSLSFSVSHIVMTSSNGNIFRVTGPLCGNSPVTGEFPSQKPVTRSFDVFFDLCLNKRLSKHSWHRRFETPSRPLWSHCNVLMYTPVDDTNDHARLRPGTCQRLIITQGVLQYRMFETLLTPKSLKSRLRIAYHSMVKSFWNFAQSKTVILPCSVHIFKKIWYWNRCSRLTKFCEIWC